MTYLNIAPPQLTKRIKKGEKLRSAQKVERIPVKVIPSENILRKPEWMRIRVSSSPNVQAIKNILRKKKLSAVCEKAACPNLSECFGNGTATLMIMGEICTRRCRLCDVGHGKPNNLDSDEPKSLAKAIHEMKLKYVVLTSVNRDDLSDGGAKHFADTVKLIKDLNPETAVEALTPDFKGLSSSIDTIVNCGLEVFAQNIETVERLTHPVRDIRAGYQQTLDVLAESKRINP